VGIDFRETKIDGYWINLSWGGDMPELFNEYEATNEAGQRLGREFAYAIEPIIRRWQQAGYSLRDIKAVMDSELDGFICEEILRAAMTKSKASRVQLNKKGGKP